MSKFSINLVNFIRTTYNTNGFIPLHAPIFTKKEKDCVVDAIDSTFVSTVGEYVSEFENLVARFTGIKYAIATVNGTSALHAALLASNVGFNDEVITQSLTFVATCNAIKYCSANPVFVDVSRETMGMSPNSLKEFLQNFAEIGDDGLCRNKKSGSIIRACLPMHSLGHPVEIDSIKEICSSYNIILIEDSAESLGSFYKGKHTGSYGESSILSFNGNKIITCGGGGMVLTNKKSIETKVRHLTTTAKEAHNWFFSHDEVGYNYRLPNINAALGYAQMERLEEYLENKRETAKKYHEFFQNDSHIFFSEPKNSKSNYWFNAFFAKDRIERDNILEQTNNNGVMTRPLWLPMHKLPMYKSCQKTKMVNTNWLFDHLICIPSSVNI
jgi:perosamine synthetase